MQVASKDKGIFISASLIKDYIKCSQMAYYRIFEPELKVSNKDMIVGDIVHKVIEKAWQDKDVALNLAKAMWDKQGVDKVGQQSIEHYVHTFFENFKPLVSKGDSIEKFFKVKLYDDVFLVGKFDRITRELVIDWKAESNPRKSIDNDPQFIIYDLAYNLIYGKKSQGIYYASLKDGKLVRYNESKQHVETIIEKIIPCYVDDIRNKKFIKTGLFNGSCYRCPFKIPCLGENYGVVRPEFTEE